MSQSVNRLRSILGRGEERSGSVLHGEVVSVGKY